MEDTSSVIKYTERDCGSSSYDSSTGKCKDGTEPKVRYQHGIVLDQTIVNDKTAVCQTEFDKTSCDIDLPIQEKLDSVVKRIYGWSEKKDSCNFPITGSSYTLTTETKINTLYPCYNVSSNAHGVCPEGFFEINDNYYDCRSIKGYSEGYTPSDCDKVGGTWFWDNPENEGPDGLSWCYIGFKDYKVTVKLDDGCGSYEEKTCTTENGEVSCDIDLPDKIGNNPVIGWTETKDSCSSVKTGNYPLAITTSINSLYPCFTNNSGDICDNPSSSSSQSSSSSSSSSNPSSSSSSSSSLSSNNSNNGNSNTNSSNNNKPGEDNDGNIITNPPTGEIIIFMIWLLGFGMIGYSISYFIKFKKN